MFFQNDGTGLKGKTVFVLGAGFSNPAGAPSQVKLMKQILGLNGTPAIRKAKKELCKFLLADLGITREAFGDVSLEDVYTPIDRCIADQTSLKSKTPSALRELRDQFGELISRAIETSIKAASANATQRTTYIKDFADRLVHLSRPKAAAAALGNYNAVKACDAIAVISLNWDILLDNALYNQLIAENRNSGPYDPFGVVDYCCYVSALDDSNTRVRSGLFSLGCKGFNVKLLKLHGSMNWLQCPNCQSLFAGFGEKERLINMVGDTLCRHCKRNAQGQHRLVRSLIMPTFLKDLTNVQMKLIWQNAGIELMEARHLIFIGYSLPHADFEFRQLLTRMIRQDVSIEVVLFNGAKTKNKSGYSAERSRYKQFFSGRQLRITGKGVEAFVDEWQRRRC